MKQVNINIKLSDVKNIENKDNTINKPIKIKKLRFIFEIIFVNKLFSSFFSISISRFQLAFSELKDAVLITLVIMNITDTISVISNCSGNWTAPKNPDKTNIGINWANANGIIETMFNDKPAQIALNPIAIPIHFKVFSTICTDISVVIVVNKKLLVNKSAISGLKASNVEVTLARSYVCDV